jgi:NAD(P)-dependent dehydrogenase (short-subunit alcohol dehydrogenase family)
MKNIVIIGAGKGIGLETTRLLQPNNHVFTVSRNATAELISLNTTFYEADTATSDLSFISEIPDTIHGLVYCPGSINLKPFNRLSEKDFTDDFQQNVLGAVRTIQKVLPNLKKANGASIVLFSTVAVKMGMPFHSSVAASKGAIEGLAKSMAAEFAASKIRVNVIAPSLTDTPLAASLLSSAEKKEAAAKRHPLNSIGNPSEIAQLVSFLISEHAAFITGQVIGADGGMGSLKV